MRSGWRAGSDETLVGLASSLLGEDILALFGVGADGELSTVALTVLGSGVVSLSSAISKQAGCQKN